MWPWLRKPIHVQVFKDSQEEMAVIEVGEEEA